MTKQPVKLIDLSSLYWTAWHATQSLEAMTITLTSVERCIGDGTSLAAICCDCGPSFRKKLDPQYKANRPEKDAAAMDILRKTEEKLRGRGLLLWSATEFEADDVIATACKAALADGHPVTICTADKDLVQLAGPGVEFLKTNQWNLMTSAEALDRFGVEASQLGDWLALVGDKSDNVPGCPGVGPVTATQLLKKFRTLAGIWEALETFEPDAISKPSVVKALKENVDNVCRSRQLVGLRFDAPIDFAEIYQERKPAAEAAREDDDMDEPDAEFTDAAEPAQPEKQQQPEAAKEAPQATETRALAIAPTYEQQLEPTSIGTAYKLARGLADSRLYTRFPNAEAIMAVIIRGREMGLGALTSLDCFHVIEGKPAPHAHLVIARAKADPDCEYMQCVETTATKATYETKNKRNPAVTRLTYTIEQAQAAGLAGRGNWKTRPDEMLRKTCAVQLARMEYPEASLGLYAAEELGEA